MHLKGHITYDGNFSEKKNKHEKQKITYDEIFSEKKSFAQYEFG